MSNTSCQKGQNFFKILKTSLRNDQSRLKDVSFFLLRTLTQIKAMENLFTRTQTEITLESSFKITCIITLIPCRRTTSLPLTQYYPKINALCPRCQNTLDRVPRQQAPPPPRRLTPASSFLSACRVSSSVLLRVMMYAGSRPADKRTDWHPSAPRRIKRWGVLLPTRPPSSIHPSTDNSQDIFQCKSFDTTDSAGGWRLWWGGSSSTYHT